MLSLLYTVFHAHECNLRQSNNNWISTMLRQGWLVQIKRPVEQDKDLVLPEDKTITENNVVNPSYACSVTLIRFSG